ncbi:MAG: hypothetical protein ABH842_04995 [Candidatus Micrarchaeota archaeon]
MANTQSRPPNLRLIKGDHTTPFNRSRTEVLLSEIQTGGPSYMKIRELSKQIKSKIAFLEAELADDGKNLRSGLQNFLAVMASSRKDELTGSGVDFRDPSDPKKVAVSLVSGETDSPEAQPKIDQIIASCIEVAKSDVEFLREVLISTRDKGSVTHEQFPKLKDILENNSYWRFIEPT